jgi:hypothetical protein
MLVSLEQLDDEASCRAADVPAGQYAGKKYDGHVGLQQFVVSMG